MIEIISSSDCGIFTNFDSEGNPEPITKIYSETINIPQAYLSSRFFKSNDFIGLYIFIDRSFLDCVHFRIDDEILKHKFIYTPLLSSSHMVSKSGSLKSLYSCAIGITRNTLQIGKIEFNIEQKINVYKR